MNYDVIRNIGEMTNREQKGLTFDVFAALAEEVLGRGGDGSSGDL